MKYKINEITFREAVKNSISIRETLKKLGVCAEGGNYRIFRRYKEKWNVDTRHFLGQGHLKNKTHNWSPAIPLKEILIENSTYTNMAKLKQKLLKANLLIYICQDCQIDSWRDKPLSLHLDHINGIDNDNRIENLRLLCPNCHSQTKTYCRKKSIAHGETRTLKGFPTPS